MSEKKKILVVEDDENTVKLLRFTLQKEGYEVYEAGSGKEALEIIGTVEPDLVITDMVMPDMDGHSLIREIRVNRGKTEQKIIVSSGKGGMKKYFELEDEEMKPQAFFEKPYRMNDLTEEISRLFCPED